jgi:hypothetical protein
MKSLGYKCYHMYELAQNCEALPWIEYCENSSTMDIDDLLGKKGYQASCDYPSSLFYQQQMARYPAAKVILTIRDPEKC